VSTQSVFTGEFLVTSPGRAVGKGARTFKFLGWIVEFHVSFPVMLSGEILLTMRTYMRSFVLMRQHMSPTHPKLGPIH